MKAFTAKKEKWTWQNIRELSRGNKNGVCFFFVSGKGFFIFSNFKNDDQECKRLEQNQSDLYQLYLRLGEERECKI